MYPARVISGMRPTGSMHLGHYHGALKNWVRIQNEVESLFFVADWHALTTHYDEAETIEQSTWDMIIDWLAAGIDPEKASIFIQSRVLEHAELTLLLGMSTPLGWLERVPTYKDQIEKISHKDLATFGFLGYPVMMAADVLVYRANQVPVGEDQIPHIEIMRELARRFNHMYGREKNFAEKAQEAVKKMGSKISRQFLSLRTAWQEKGNADALAEARALLEGAGSLSMADRERLIGWLEGTGKQVLVEPQALLTEASRLPGLDNQKMSKSYGNAISLRETRDEINRKIRTMQTDPARVRRTDPGDPEKCPVWQFHVVYSDSDTCEWVKKGCRSAGIGCIECKQPVIDAIVREQEPFHERAQKYLDNPGYVREIVAAGCEKARSLAQETMRDVREAMGLNYG
jgi:tryptophanyl-tRNA synthetase